MRPSLRYLLVCVAALTLAVAAIGDKTVHAAGSEPGHAAVETPHSHGPEPHGDDCHGLPGGGCQITGVAQPPARFDVGPDMTSEAVGAIWDDLNDLLSRPPPSPPPNPA